MLIRAIHNRDNPYFQMRRDTAQDSTLTWEARGVLSYLFSKSDDWELRAEDLIKQTEKSRKPLRRDGVQAVLNELEAHGYLHRYQPRREDGTLGAWRADVYESPHPAQPVPARPVTAEPEPAEPEHTNKREVQITEKKKKTEQQQAAAKKAAAADSATVSGASRFAFEQIRQFVLATKTHAQNPGGLARHLQQTGEEDEAIASWIERQSATPPVADAQAELLSELLAEVAEIEQRCQLEGRAPQDYEQEFINAVAQYRAA